MNITTKWFRSKMALLKYLANVGLEGRNGRILRDGILLTAWNIYGQYSSQCWFVQLSISVERDVLRESKS